MNVSALDNAIDSLDKLLVLERRKQELHHELRKSLLLLKLVGENLFKVGKVTTQVLGNPRRDLTFAVKLDDAQWRTWPLEDVPMDLWPESVIADIRSQWGSNKYRRLLKEAEQLKEKGRCSVTPQ